MLRLLIFVASFSAAVPLQDSTEPYSGTTSFPSFPDDGVSDSNSNIYDTVPNRVNSVAPNILASNLETDSESLAKNDPGNQAVSNQNINNDNLAFNLNAFGPSVQLSDSVPSPPLQPTSPLVLASASGTDENPVTIESTEPDQNLWTVAQNSDSSCRTENSKGLDTQSIDACPDPSPSFYVRSPVRAHTTPGKKPRKNFQTILRDQAWLRENPEAAAVVDWNRQGVCEQLMLTDKVWRPYAFCCDDIITLSYDVIGWVTDRLNCVTLLAARPICEDPDDSWFCCHAVSRNPRSLYGWEGINCVKFPQLN